jgi:hypothetical protein
MHQVGKHHADADDQEQLAQVRSAQDQCAENHQQAQVAVMNPPSAGEGTNRAGVPRDLQIGTEAQECRDRFEDDGAEQAQQ